MNLKLGVQGVGLNLCKSSLGAAYWARVSWLEHERRILKTHVLSLHAAASTVRFEDVFRKVELKARRFALSSRSTCVVVSIDSILRSQFRTICTKLLT